MGNTHAKRQHQTDVGLDDGFAAGSPPPSPTGEPLTYTPQPLMEPLPKPADLSFVTGSHGGSHVEVEGSFDNWTTRQPMQRSGKDFTIVKLLAPGVYQYKFIVDGEWKYAPDQTAMYDEMGNVNNVLEVQEYVPENLDSLSGFEPPPSPPSSYNNSPPTAEDYAKEPAAAPPHLQLTLLNVPPAMDAIAALPRPQHVILNHIYCERSSQQVQAVVLGMTHRYKSKYITTVMYKPRRRRREPAAPDHSHAQAMLMDGYLGQH